MKQIVFYLLFWIAFSCNHNREKMALNQEDSITTSAIKNTQVEPTPINVDSLPKQVIEVDGFPLSDDMLRNQSGAENSSYIKKSGETISMDKAWFISQDLSQVLIFELYTDQHRLVTYHFFSKDIPIQLIERIELYSQDRNAIDTQQKIRDFKGFLNQAEQIDQEFFTSNKGISLGDNKSKVVKIYGQPDLATQENGLEHLQWNFVGDLVYDGKESLYGKPLAKDSYGHQADLFFQDGKLIGQILFNDIP